MLPQQVSNYRRDAQVDDVPRDACRGCGGHAWADLRSEAVCEGLEDRDAQWRAARNSSGGLASRLLHWAKTAMVGGSEAVLSAHPARWRAWIPSGRPGPAQRGTVEAWDPSECCVAPLTGRPCLGYEIAIHDDARAGSPDASWLLLEQQVASLRFEGRRLDGERIRLMLPRRPTTIRVQGLGPFLRRRGLVATGLSLMICESILEPGAVMEHREHEGGGSTLISQGTVPTIIPGR